MSSATSTDPGLRPWQLFVLAGMLAATGVVLVSKGQTLPGIVVLSLTVVAASFVAVAAYRSLAPLASAAGADAEDDTPLGGRVRAALEREKALVLRSIKELEFDHAMGKTGAADFEEMRGRLTRRAVGLMRQLEGADSGPRSSATSPPAPCRPRRSPGPPRRCRRRRLRPAEAPAEAAADRRPASTLARVCGACQGVNDVDARFCKHCGAHLTEGAS
ncbi:MAG: zinc ribbon domain-containing protein [Vicinamibacterales bacterium]